MTGTTSAAPLPRPVRSSLDLIGRTPMVELTTFDTGPCRLFVKLESQNPGGSIKDRIALSMIDAAERDGRLKPGGTIVEATAGNTGLGLAQVALPKDLSVWGMFVAADWVVQGVMIGLVLASVLTWTVFVAKSLELAMAVRRQRRLLAAVDSAPSLDRAPASDLVAAAQAEERLSADTVDDRDGLKERVASRLERLEAATGRRMLKGTGVLATIGSTAPFVGLFGTVWGIMNSFIGISRSQTTNLAVVAPGIAEALLATALGLAAAIPAVVIYNHFSRRVTAYRALVGDTSAAVLRLVSRDLGRR